MDIAWLLPGASKLSIRLTVSDATPPFLIGDWGAMTQILLNLLSNAIKFTEKGWVELSVDFDQKSSQLLLKVSDTGWGITPAYREIIFQPFERGRAAGSICDGTCLGLTMVKQLTDRIGESIRLLDTSGAGSTFIVELPMAATSSVPGHTVAKRSPEVAHGSQSLRILVAEDVAANRMVIEALLRKQGHSVHLSSNGLEALEAINKWHFDAVLMDVQMPEMGGIEATRTIRKMPGPAGKIRIIGLTAFLEPEQHALMLDAGMDLCLTKPLQTPDLFAALTWKSGPVALKKTGS
jgi:CheY-like chemotaxis protein